MGVLQKGTSPGWLNRGPDPEDRITLSESDVVEPADRIGPWIGNCPRGLCGTGSPPVGDAGGGWVSQTPARLVWWRLGWFVPVRFVAPAGRWTVPFSFSSLVLEGNCCRGDISLSRGGCGRRSAHL